MSQTHNETPASQTPVIPDPETSLSLFRRMGASLLLYSFVFTGILSASWTYVLPRLTRIQLQGQVVDLSVVIPYENKLKAQIASAETKRNLIVMPVNDADYDTLKRRSICYLPLEDLTAEIAKTAKAVGENAVVFSAAQLASDGTLVLEGDVRNVGPRSMTVLARLTEDLRALPLVAEVATPVFNREKDPLIGFLSPFRFVITLTPSDACPADA
jgi:hypothetical protein